MCYNENYLIVRGNRGTNGKGDSLYITELLFANHSGKFSLYILLCNIIDNMQLELGS